MEMTQSSPNQLKTLWEKEKLLLTSNFSFSHSVFKGTLPQTRKNQGLFGKGLNGGEQLTAYNMFLNNFRSDYLNGEPQRKNSRSNVATTIISLRYI